MLLTISTTHQPATDIGYLLAKNPARVQHFPLNFGTAHVFYPEATDERCTVALLLDIDPISLVRGRSPGSEGLLDQYVNDRPYVASSFLSVALAEVFGTAMSGRSRERPTLAESAIPLEAYIAAIPAHGGPAIVERLFAPLGYEVEIGTHQLDARFPAWGDSLYISLTLRGTVTLSSLLAHLYVLIPVLDADKHYYFGPDEIAKLLRRGEGWLSSHPERELITNRYLRRRRYIRAALAQLIAEEGQPELDDESDADPIPPLGDSGQVNAPKINLHTQRLHAVTAMLKTVGAKRVLDLGCGEGRLIRLLLDEPQFSEIRGMDVAYRSLAKAQDWIERQPPIRQQRVNLIQGSLIYRDERLVGYDAAAIVEVIEHLDPARLSAFERNLFTHIRPNTIIITTPNAEYNIRYERLAAGSFRHADHRFEWTRAEFAAWCERLSQAYGYQYTIYPIGDEDAEVGGASQMVVFQHIT